MRRRWLAIGACTVAACATGLVGLRMRGGTDHIRVPHARHAAAQVDCVVCHEPVYDAQGVGHGLLPREAKCLECHGERKASGQCEFCHTAVEEAAFTPERAPRTHLAHAPHLERVDEACDRCHQKLPEPFATGVTTEMSSCLGCHEHQTQFDEGRCNGCHFDLRAAPPRPRRDPAHRAGFAQNHGAAARSVEAACRTCHEPQDCANCHTPGTTPLSPVARAIERVDLPLWHRGDLLARHGIEARTSSCQRCHEPSACQTCHEAQNLTPLGSDPRDPHPPGWANRGGSAFHGTEARRDIASCAACHDQGAASICVDCHRSGGVGGDPHPPGWSGRHGRAEISGSGTCLICHR